LYERRWDIEKLKLQKHDFQQPIWLGKESIAGKTVLLHAEQGLGDAIQFCRYAEAVAALGARVVLEAPAALIPLLRSLAGVSDWVAAGSPLPHFDLHCPFLSLPLAFGTDRDTIPARPRYLAADAGKLAQWAGRLGKTTRPRIGLAWSGNPGHILDHQRSLLFADLIRHLPSAYQYVSLQKVVRDIDQPPLASRRDVLAFGDDLVDFSDTAALCELMDLVISVDTSVAHLSGGLGRPTWILLPFHPDWRWLLDRDDSPWYPSATLFRQDKAGGWDALLRRVARALAVHPWDLAGAAVTEPGRRDG
jgi:hypothetical protein